MTRPAVRQWAFYVDSDACSGCKTCQVACKDKNNLAPGVHWRKVTEVTGGAWENRGGLWVSTVAAYHLSTSCHHCQNPPCVPACTTEAVWKQDDGVVFIDGSRCIRCGQCAAACPYGAIRPDPDGVMTKCDFCADELDAGLPPICVAACPNRALDFGDLDDLRKKYGEGTTVFPLPDPGETRPALIVKPHRDSAFIEKNNPEVGNWAEI